MESARGKNVQTLYNESLDRLAKADKNLFRASAGACSTKSLRATTIMMDGNKALALGRPPPGPWSPLNPLLCRTRR